MKSLLLVAILISIATADQFVPIPKTPYGFNIGAENGQFHIEAFLDLQCIVTLMQVLIQKTPMKLLKTS